MSAKDVGLETSRVEDTEYVDADIGLRIVDKGKTLERKCYFCNKQR